jgi:uncharacterized membrane protein AbrB (regulator of aidB expression)
METDTANREPEVTNPDESDQSTLTESEKYFQVERVDETRKQFATYSIYAGLTSILLLMIPNPVPWLFGPLAILLGVHALVRILLQPTRHGGTVRAIVGIIIGIISTLVALRW